MIRDIINLSKMSMLGLFYLFTEIYFLLVIKENFLNIPPPLMLSNICLLRLT